MNLKSKKIDELKLMQSYPRLYIANYFSDLKRQVDLTFALKLDKKQKYLEIIDKIELIESESYKIKAFNTFDFELNQKLKFCLGTTGFESTE